MKIVYTGGFASGKKAVGLAVSQLKNAHGVDTEVEGYTYSSAIRNPLEYKDSLSGADKVVTHSIGYMALYASGVDVMDVYAVAPPLPTSRKRLFGRTILKTVGMLRSAKTYGVKNVLTYLTSSAFEIARHPVSVLKPFFNGNISRFDSSSIGRSDTFIYSQTDDYYRDRLNALSADAIVGQFGCHDQMLFDDQIATIISQD